MYSEYEQEKPGKYSNPHLEADVNDFAHVAKIEVNRSIAEACNISEQKMSPIPSSSQNVHISRNSADKIRRIICDYWDIPEYNREHLRKRNFEGAKPQVGYTSDSWGDKYDEAFGKNKGNGNDEITKLREDVAKLTAIVNKKKSAGRPKKKKAIKELVATEG